MIPEIPEPPYARDRHSEQVLADRTICREARAGFLDGKGLPALRTLELNICVFCDHLVPSHVVLFSKSDWLRQKNYAA